MEADEQDRGGRELLTPLCSRITPAQPAAVAGDDRPGETPHQIWFSQGLISLAGPIVAGENGAAIADLFDAVLPVAPIMKVRQANLIGAEELGWMFRKRDEQDEHRRGRLGGAHPAPPS